MVEITEKCIGCGMCVRQCPVGALTLVDRGDGKKKIAKVSDRCIGCGVCLRVCKFDGVRRISDIPEDAVICTFCPVQCQVLPGNSGACQRFTNVDGTLQRNRPLVLKNEKITEQDFPDARIREPIITAVGAGSNYPCIRPAPFIVSEKRDGIDVVTVVTEAPLSYSGVVIKLDTNTYIGEEGDIVYRDNRPVGMVQTEEYGSKMIAVGGANRLTGEDGFTVVRTIVELANGEAVDLSINRKVKLKVQRGKTPVINGVEETVMRFGCGSATVGIFADRMKKAVDECIVVDHHVVGLLTEHLAGKEVGLSWSGVIPNAKRSSRGRYFGEHGEGIAGTQFATPRDAILSVDMDVAKPGLNIFVTSTTGEVRALFEVKEDGAIEEIALTEAVIALADEIRANCETSTASILYVGGTGGSARGGVTRAPLAITKAVHNNSAHLTVGGAPVFVMPGGGINFMVDTAKVVDQAFTWVPTPATVCPVEYTMKRDDYERMDGHAEHIVDVETLKNN